SFSFKVDPDCDYQIEAVGGDGAAWTWRFIRHDDTKPLVMTLAPTVTTLIRVVDAQTGAPIANAHAETRGLMSLPHRATTAGSRLVRVRGLDHRSRFAKLTMSVGIGAPGYLSNHVEIDGTLPGGGEQTVRLERGLPVSGVVFLADGGFAARGDVDII